MIVRMSNLFRIYQTKIHISVIFIFTNKMATCMKTPSEVIVWHILPIIRRDLAKELATTYHMKQADVGRLFGVTDAAISQYIKNKRGACASVENSMYYRPLCEEVHKSAELLHAGVADIVVELCRLCEFARKSGLLAEIYVAVTGCSDTYGESIVSNCVF